MALVFSIPGKPRGRGKIERIFESVNQLFLCHQPGSSPPGSPPAKPVLTLPELDARLRTFLVETYHRQPHSETGCPAAGALGSGRFPAAAARLTRATRPVASDGGQAPACPPGWYS